MNYYQQPFGCVNPTQMMQPAPMMPPLMASPQMLPGMQMMPGMSMMPGMPMGPDGHGIMLPQQQLQFEQSYIENILRLNRGKVATVYMNFEGSQWNSKIFKGIVLAAGRDHIVLKDLQSEVRYVLLTVYLNYFTFDEAIDYDYPIRGKKAKEK